MNPKKKRKGTAMRKRNAPALAPPPNPRRRRRRNPDGRGALGGVVSIAIPSILGGGVAGFVDAKFLAGRSKIVSVLGKAGTAILLGIFGRRMMSERATTAAMGGVLGSISYPYGAAFGAGVNPFKELVEGMGDEGGEVEGGGSEDLEDIYLGALETDDD